MKPTLSLDRLVGFVRSNLMKSAGCEMRSDLAKIAIDRMADYAAGILHDGSIGIVRCVHYTPSRKVSWGTITNDGLVTTSSRPYKVPCHQVAESAFTAPATNLTERQSKDTAEAFAYLYAVTEGKAKFLRWLARESLTSNANGNPPDTLITHVVKWCEQSLPDNHLTSCLLLLQNGDCKIPVVNRLW